MNPDILETFYGKLLPTFPPQAEKIIYALQPERFNKLAFRYTFSVDAMLAISHIIENAVADTPNAADLHVSFQYLSRLVPQRAIYKNLTLSAKGLWLYCSPDAGGTETADILGAPRTTLIDTSNSHRSKAMTGITKDFIPSILTPPMIFSKFCTRPTRNASPNPKNRKNWA